MSEIQTHINYASSPEAQFISDLPWKFDSHVFGNALLVELSMGLFARISVVDGGVDERDKTSRVIAGFRVEVVHRLNGPVIAQDFHFRDFVDDSAAEGSYVIKRVKGKVVWINDKGVKKVQDSFYIPICTAIGGFIAFVSNPTVGTIAPITVSDGVPRQSSTASSRSSGQLIAITGL